MMEQIREGSQSWIVKIILGLIILSFALTGVYSYLRGGPAGNAVAKVNGQSISRNELERAYQNERARMESQNPSLFKQLAGNDGFVQQMRKGALQQLVNQKLVASAIADMGLRVSDEQVKNAIRDFDAFKVNGKFSNDRYRAVLHNQNMSPTHFSELVRADLARQQFVDAVMQTAIVLPSEAKSLYEAARQTRDGKAVIVKAADFTDKVEVTDADIKARYDANKTGYMAPQQVALHYLELSADDLKKDVKVTDQQIAAYYKDNTDQFMRPEQRRASHILFTGKDAEAKAKKALAEINGGKSFADVAKAESADTFSAKKGGDLGWNEKGVYDKAFDKALFAINKTGEVVGPIKSSFGYHLIKLTGIKPGAVKSLDEVKDQVRDKLAKKAADDLFYKKQDKIEQLAFENANSLQEAADAAGIKVQHTALFTKANAPKAVNYPKVLDAAFSDSVLQDKINSEVIEVAPEHIFVVRAADYKPAHRKPLAEVQDAIKANLTKEKAEAKAKAVAQSLLDAISDGKPVDTLLQQHQLSYSDYQAVNRNDQKVPANIVKALFAQSKGESELVNMASGDSAVVQVTAIHPYTAGKDDDSIIKMWQKQLQQQRVNAANQQFVEALRKEADVKVYSLER